MLTMRVRVLLLLTVLLALASASAHAQHPRPILIEEATNASCDPCARQDPIFAEFLAKPDVEPYVTTLVYHAFWPGPDTMNKRAPAMNDARIRGYYGMFGMPSAVVNGRAYASRTSGLAASVPADTNALRALVDSLRGLTSPIALSVVDTIEDDRIRIATTITAGDTLAGRLRVAIVERHHFYPYPTAGTNGEEHFQTIVRAMLPTHEGRAVALAAGATLKVLDTIGLDPEWNRAELYVVAFVQDDSTREVLQVATTRERLRIAARSGAVASADTATLAASTTAVATRSGRYVVGIDATLPEGWTSAVRVDGEVRDDGDTVSLAADVEVPIAVAIEARSGVGGKGVVRVTLTGDRGATDTVEYRLYSGALGIPVFEWYSRFTPEVGPLVAASLDRTEHTYVMIPREDSDLFTLSDHRLVVVLVGDDTLDAAQRLRLRELLDRRGRLLISGSQIAQSLGDLEYDQTGIPRDTAFLHTYLHATYIAPTSASLAVNGLRNDPIAANVGFILNGGRRVPGTPDRVRPRRNALPVFHYGSSRDSIGALRYGRAEHRVVYIAFGVEAIADTNQRATVLGRSIDWLLGSEITTGVTIASAASPTLSIAPNPASATVIIDRTDAGARTAASLRLIDVLGRTVLTRSIEPGTRRVAVDVSSLSQGVHLVVVDDGTGRTSVPLMVE